MSLILILMLFGPALVHSGERQRPGRVKAETFATVFTTTVDWYKPPPKSFDLDHGVRLPYQLFSAVPARLTEEATTLLGEADILPLTTEQLRRFSSTSDPDVILRARIHEADEKRRFFQENPVEEKVLKPYGKEEVKRARQRQQRIVEGLDSEIKWLRQWENQLKPYLIKAVALQAGGSFSGTFISEDLVIGFGAMGSHPVPMERRPVVAFLPKEPRKLYTVVSMMQ